MSFSVASGDSEGFAMRTNLLLFLETFEMESSIFGFECTLDVVDIDGLSGTGNGRRLGSTNFVLFIYQHLTGIGNIDKRPIT